MQLHCVQQSPTTHRQLVHDVADCRCLVRSFFNPEY